MLASVGGNVYQWKLSVSDQWTDFYYRRYL